MLTEVTWFPVVISHHQRKGRLEELQRK